MGGPGRLCRLAKWLPCPLRATVSEARWIYESGNRLIKPGPKVLSWFSVRWIIVESKLSSLTWIFGSFSLDSPTKAGLKYISLPPSLGRQNLANDRPMAPTKANCRPPGCSQLTMVSFCFRNVVAWQLAALVATRCKKWQAPSRQLAAMKLRIASVLVLTSK